MKTIVFRTDASFEIGTGHVYRCLTLADDLKKRGANVIFLCRAHPGHLSSFIKEKGFKVFLLNRRRRRSMIGLRGYERWLGNRQTGDANEVIVLFKKKKINPSVLIVDHYGIDARWEKLVAPHVKKIMVIDDLANRPHRCQILLDQNFYFNQKSRYQKLVPRSCKLFLGPQYALLRDEFISERTKRKLSEKLKRIFVFMGGSDFQNTTQKILIGLEPVMAHLDQVDVVSGRVNRWYTKLVMRYREQNKVKFYWNINSISKLMRRADVGIGGGGISTWERMAIGLPSIAVVQAKNQNEIVGSLLKLNCVISLGWASKLTAGRVNKIMQTLMKNPKRLLRLRLHSERLMELGSFRKNRVKLVKSVLLN